MAMLRLKNRTKMQGLMARLKAGVKMEGRMAMMVLAGTTTMKKKATW